MSEPEALEIHAHTRLMTCYRFQFFGINNGDLANMNLDLGLGPQ